MASLPPFRTGWLLLPLALAGCRRTGTGETGLGFSCDVLPEGDVPTPSGEAGDWSGSPLGLYNGLNTVEPLTEEDTTLEEATEWVLRERLPVMREMGMGTSRIHDEDGFFSFAWPAVDADRDGQDLDFEQTDLLWALACDADIGLLPTISPGSRETRREGAAFLPHEQGWTTFVKNVVERYDGDTTYTVDGAAPEPDEDTRAAIEACPGHHWMVGNELDLLYAETDDTWCPPDGYANALLLAHDAAHEVDDAARIVYGGLSNISDFESEPWGYFEAVVEALDGGGIDEMAVHFYPESLDFFAFGLELMDAVRSLTGNPPLWITEAGVLSRYTESNKMQDEDASQLSQARGVLGLQVGLLARSPRPLLYIDVDWLGSLSVPFDGAGLQDAETGERRLAWYAWRKLARVLAVSAWDEAETVLAEGGRYAWRMPLAASSGQSGTVHLLLSDVDGDFDGRAHVVEVEGSLACVEEAVPWTEAGADVEDEDDAFRGWEVDIDGGTVTLEPGDRPLWLFVLSDSDP